MKNSIVLIGILVIVACNTESPKEVFDNAVSNEDTLVYFHEKNGESKQQLKVVFTSDSTIWYMLGFENETGTQLLKGEGIDIYYNLDPEIDEINGEAQPVMEYEATGNNQGLVIRIDMMEKSFAKVLTSPDYQMKEKPLDQVLMKR